MPWRKFIFISLLSLSFGSSYSLAAKEIIKDERLKTELYSPNRVFNIAGSIGIQTVIIFAEDENIENVAIGDSIGWQVTPNKRGNLLFIKPILPDADTNLTVVTNERYYMFDLSQAQGDQPHVYSFRFSYPPKERPADKKDFLKKKDDKEEPLEIPKMETPTLLNFKWEYSGSKYLRPLTLFDDGKSTFIKWDEKAKQPAIFEKSGPSNELRLINYSIKNGYVIIDHIPTELLFELGRRDARILKQGTAQQENKTQEIIRDPSILNFNWDYSGSKHLHPSHIFDDGRSTFLKWNVKDQQPAIFEKSGPSKKVRLVNYVVQNGYIIIDHVADQIILKLGRKKAKIIRRSPTSGDIK